MRRQFDFSIVDLRPCDHQPCLNNGTCVVYLRTYLCQCQVGFTGRSCEMSKYLRHAIDIKYQWILLWLDLMMKDNEELCNRTMCIHGDCSISGKCICHDGWTSDNCNQNLIRSMFFFRLFLFSRDFIR
jgi:Notch-like protein